MRTHRRRPAPNHQPGATLPAGASRVCKATCAKAPRGGRLPQRAARPGGALSVVDGRFPGFAALARHAGVGAVFAFPICHHDTGLGALDLYCDHPTGLAPEVLAATQIPWPMSPPSTCSTPEPAANCSPPSGLGVGPDRRADRSR